MMYEPQHSTAQHSTAQHSTAQHSTAQHSTILSPQCLVKDVASNIILNNNLNLFSSKNLLKHYCTKPQLQSTLTKLLNPTKILLASIILIGATACGGGGGGGSSDTPPATPTPKLTATASDSDSQITLKWQAVSGSDYYEIYRSTSTTTTSASIITKTKIASPLTSAGTEYVDSGLTFNATYYYWLKYCKTSKDCIDYASANATTYKGFNACGKVYSTKAAAEKAAKDCLVDDYSKLEQLILQTGEYNFGKKPLAKLSSINIDGEDKKSFVSDGYDENVHFVFKNPAKDNFKICNTFDNTYPSYYIEDKKKFVVTLRQRTFTESAGNPALTDNTANTVYDLLKWALGKKSKVVNGEDVYQHYNIVNDIVDDNIVNISNSAIFGLSYGINEKGDFYVECKGIAENKYSCDKVKDFANHAFFVAPAGPIRLFAKTTVVNNYGNLNYPKGIVTVKAAYQLMYDEFKKDTNITMGKGKWSYGEVTRGEALKEAFEIVYKMYSTDPLFCSAPKGVQHVFFAGGKPFPAHYN